jgi:hypothetical protein
MNHSHFEIWRNHLGRWAVVGFVITLLSAAAQAALQDEIQVYTDEINKPGEYGLELHVNSTPIGISAPSYPGEITSLHGVRITPEFSRGLTQTVELGLYVPTVLAPSGSLAAPGLKARVKWLPIQAEQFGGFFAGLNLEYSQINNRYAASPRGGEMRNILGWRNDDWLLAINPIFGFAYSPGVPHTPGLEIATKISRKINDVLAVGWERYNERGPYNQWLPSTQQMLVNYVVADVQVLGYDFNLGVGKGQTTASDKWTLKAIIGFPLWD